MTLETPTVHEPYQARVESIARIQGVPRERPRAPIVIASAIGEDTHLSEFSKRGKRTGEGAGAGGRDQADAPSPVSDIQTRS